MELTNLAANAGKGEVVGASPFAVGHGTNTLKKVASGRMLHHATDVENIVSYPLKKRDFFEPPLPPRWKWTSGWMVDKTEFVDNDGWAYGLDYQSLKWPPTSSMSGAKSTPDAVRRKRWIRPREQVSKPDRSDFINVGNVIHPDSSAVLPWRSMSRDSDLCLRVRPHVDSSQSSYLWGHFFVLGDRPSIKQGNLMHVTALRLNQLEIKDMLLSCPGNGGTQFWFSVVTDASILHIELNNPVYDWKISISSPLKLENRLPCPAQFKNMGEA